MDLFRQIDKQTFLRLIVLGLVLLVLYQILFKNKIVTHKEKNFSLENEWINNPFGYGYGSMNPSTSLTDLVKEFGRPSLFDPKKGGVAIWDKNDLKGTPYERIEIRDEQIPHDKPQKHVDFLYSWYRIDIPEHKIGGLHQISESISYDPLKKIMVARCHDMRPNVVTHWIVKKYAEGSLEIDEAVGMYGPMILELFENDPIGSKYQNLLNDL